MQGSMIEENIIIREPSRNLRTLGRNALAGKWKVAIITMIVFLLVQSVPPAIFDAIFGTNVVTTFNYNGYTFGMDAETYADFINHLPHYCTLSAVYVMVITGALYLGLALFALGVFRGAELHVSDIFLGFEKFGKALGLYLFVYLFTFLWTLLFIVPGIIAFIRYSQSFFILADDSSKGIRQCVRESRAMMRGNKAKYFCLTLSFIGWWLLAAIPESVIGSIGTVVSTNGFVISLFAILGSLCVAPVYAYVCTTLAGFYEILAGHLIKETMPIPVTTKDVEKAYEEMTAAEEAEESAEAENSEEAEEGESEEAEKPEEAAAEETEIKEENNEQE